MIEQTMQVPLDQLRLVSSALTVHGDTCWRLSRADDGRIEERKWPHES